MESLPIEVIAHIMCFLKHRDQCSLALTAKKFYEAYHDPKVAKNIVLRFDFCILDVNSNPLKLFSKSTFKYQRLILGACIKDIILNDKEVCVTFWKRFGKNFKEIVIETPGKMGMILIAKYMPNIKKLKIRNPGTRSICFGKNEKMGLQRNLCNVTQLEICSNYEQLEEILELIPKLEILELGGFNCKQQRTYNRNNALSIHFLIHYITKVRALELKGLLLHSYCVELSANELFFYNLANVTGLLLQKLTCSIEGVPIELLRQLFHNMQNSLKSLDVTSWAGISAEIYSLIFTHLRNIENLTFRGRLNMNGLLQVSELKYLKVLKFTDTFKDIESKNEVIHFLSKLKLCENLQELQIDTKCLNSTECKICFKEFVTHLNVTNNLQILNISKSNIDDKNLSLLIFCLRNLKELYMNDCKYITKFECHKKCKAKVKNEPVKIGQLICQLQVLELSHCINLVTDGIQSLFYLTNLRELSLNNLESITQVIIEIIGTNCFSLEKLNLANCRLLNDTCIDLLATHLKRLRLLNISGCKALTKSSESSLWKFCNLKYLYAVGLERLKWSIIMLFIKVPTLYLYRCTDNYTRIDFENEKCFKKLQFC